MRTASVQHHAPHAIGNAVGGLARRWYYTPRSHRAYSVRQIAPGDRRLLAEFALSLAQSDATSGKQGDPAASRDLTQMLFDRVLAGGRDMSTGFAALESTAAGDRIIGVAAYAPTNLDDAQFCVAVVSGFRDEQVGRTLLSSLVRHAKRVGLRCLRGEMFWSNRPMQLLARATGFSVESLAHDRNHRGLVLTLK